MCINQNLKPFCRCFENKATEREKMQSGYILGKVGDYLDGEIPEAIIVTKKMEAEK